MCVQAFPEDINHSNTNVGVNRTALSDQVRKEPWGLGDRGVTGQRDKIMVSLIQPSLSWVR